MPSFIGLLLVVCVASLALLVPGVSGYPSLLSDGRGRFSRSSHVSHQQYRRLTPNNELHTKLLNSFHTTTRRRVPREADEGNSSGHDEYRYVTASSVENDDYVYPTETNST